MVAAVSELKETYAGKVDFEILSIKDDVAADFAEKHFPDGKHGMLAYGKDGKLMDKIEGHTFGKDEIVALAKKCM